MSTEKRELETTGQTSTMEKRPDISVRFAHRPLETDKKSIRLLEIHPAPDGEPIECTLTHHYLEDNPSYIALSYTWNQDGMSKIIVCDGTALEVGMNLWAFLHQFRKRRSIDQYLGTDDHSPYFLWIDAICIDQTNLKERSAQVAQMMDIYSQAASVIAWLGVNSHDEELAFLLTRYPHLLYVSELQSALLGVLNNPYWCRVWVVQEFVLGKSVSIWCGTFSAEAAAFDNLWGEDKVLPRVSKLAQDILQTKAWPLFKHRREFWKRRSNTLAIDESLEKDDSIADFRLRDLLISFKNSKSSEIYDKVYGFLGIASDTMKAGHPIVPDYSKEAVELLVDVLRNQFHKDIATEDAYDIDFVTFLRRMLGVSRMSFMKHLLQNSSAVEDSLYVLVASDFMVAPLTFISTVEDLGSAELIGGDIPKALTTFMSTASHPRGFPKALVSSLLTRSDTAQLFSFSGHHNPASMSQRTDGLRRLEVMQNSTQAVTESITKANEESDSDKDSQSDSDEDSEQSFDNAAMLQFIHRSASLTTLDLLSHKETQPRKTTPYEQNKYASFRGDNGVFGVLCIYDSDNQDISTGDKVCVFADDTTSDKAIIVRKLQLPERWVIVGIAAIVYSKPDPTPQGILQSFQSAIRRTNTKDVVENEVDDDDIPTRQTTTNMCFHCHFADLLELSRCGILKSSQLYRVLEQSLQGDENDEVHKCSLGLSQFDVLEFES